MKNMKSMILPIAILALLVSVYAAQPTKMTLEGSVQGVTDGNIGMKISTQASCTAGIVFDQNYEDVIFNNDFNVLLGENADLNMNYNDDYWACLYVNGLIAGSPRKFRGGQGEIKIKDMNMVDLNRTFVPYIGALADINLGVYGLTSNDLNISGSVSVSGNVFFDNNITVDTIFAEAIGGRTNNVMVLSDMTFVAGGGSSISNIGELGGDNAGDSAIGIISDLDMQNNDLTNISNIINPGFGTSISIQPSGSAGFLFSSGTPLSAFYPATDNFYDLGALKLGLPSILLRFRRLWLSGDFNTVGKAYFYDDVNAFDANFANIGVSGKYFGDGSGLTGISTLDLTLDTNADADANWLNTVHKFTADQNFTNIQLPGNIYMATTKRLYLSDFQFIAAANTNVIDIGTDQAAKNLRLRLCNTEGCVVALGKDLASGVLDFAAGGSRSFAYYRNVNTTNIPDVNVTAYGGNATIGKHWMRYGIRQADTGTGAYARYWTDADLGIDLNNNVRVSDDLNVLGTTSFNNTITLHGNARVKRELIFPARNSAKGASSPPTVLRDLGAAGTLKEPVVQFSEVTQQDVYGVFHPPSDIDNSQDVEVHLMWAAGEGWTAGDYKWCFEYLIKYEDISMGTDVNYTTGVPTTICETVTPTNATAMIETEFTGTIDVDFEQTVSVHFYRDVASDNGDDTGDVRFFEAEYVANSLGEAT